jgi:type VI secretion system protein ImpK
MPSAKPDNPLLALFSDLLLLGAISGDASEIGNVGKFRERVMELFQHAEQDGQRMGIPRDTLRLAKFAVAAFLDEMILNSSCPQREEWAFRTLQYELFNTQEAGVEFFQELNAVRHSVPLNVDLLELYYSCLTLGFEGQYTLTGREKRKGLINDLAHDLQVKQAAHVLSPHAERPDTLAVVEKRTFIPWVAVVASIVTIIACYVALSLTMNSTTEDVREDIEAKVRSVDKIDH